MISERASGDGSAEQALHQRDAFLLGLDHLRCDPICSKDAFDQTLVGQEALRA